MSKVSTSVIPNLENDPSKFNAKAYINVKTDGKQCHIKFKGTTSQLADMVFTLMRQNENLAAIICHVSKDFMRAKQGSAEEMETFSENYRDVHRKLVNRYPRTSHRQASKPEESEPAATEPTTTSDQKEAEP